MCCTAASCRRQPERWQGWWPWECSGPKTLLVWRDSFAAFLRLGAAACWEPAQLEPTLVALRRLAVAILAPSAMVMAAVAATALGAGVLQTGGLNIHAEAVGFKFDRINPVSNIKNLFSLRAAAQVGQVAAPGGPARGIRCRNGSPVNSPFRHFRRRVWSRWARTSTA